MSLIKTINKTEFENEVLKGNKPTLIDFYADWCGPCRALSPILENVQAELAEKVNIVKINIDKEADIAKRYGVMSIPTMILVDGEEKERIIGLVNKNVLIDKINKKL